MKLRAIVFSLEWIFANTLVFRVLDNHKYSFYTFPWILWNITFGIFLTKLFLAPNDDDTKTKTPWPIGPTVGSFGFVLTAIKIDSDGSASSGNIRFAVTIVGYCMCLLGFALIGLASDALGEEWRDAPPPSENSGGTTNVASKLVPPKRIHNLVTNGPYAIVRHPIYCGLLLEALGSNVVGGFSSWIAIGAFCAVSTAYVIQLGQEERELDLLLEGKYENVYKKNTRYKLVPFLY